MWWRLEDDVELVRRAIALIRERAAAATPGRWSVFDLDDAAKLKGRPLNEPGQGWYWVWSDERRPYYGGILVADIGEACINGGIGGKNEQADAEHIAGWDPVAAEAVAVMLEDALEAHMTVRTGNYPFWVKAVAVARAYLGEKDEGA